MNPRIHLRLNRKNLVLVGRKVILLTVRLMSRVLVSFHSEHISRSC
jgi:hypothetical protein